MGHYWLPQAAYPGPTWGHSSLSIHKPVTLALKSASRISQLHLGHRDTRRVILAECLLYRELPQKERNNITVPPKQERSHSLSPFSHPSHHMLQSACLAQFKDPSQQGEGWRCFLQDGWAEPATGSHRTSQLGKRRWAFWQCWSIQAACQVRETTASKHKTSNPYKVRPLSFGFRWSVPLHAKHESAKSWAGASSRQSACQVKTRPLPGANRQI